MMPMNENKGDSWADSNLLASTGTLTLSGQTSRQDLDWGAPGEQHRYHVL